MTAQNSTAEQFGPFQRLFSACVGGTLSAFIVCPLDVVKARLQAQIKTPPTLKNSREALIMNRCSGTCKGRTVHTHTLRFNGTVDAFFKIARHEGVSSLWNGLGASIIVNVPGIALYFSLYEGIRHQFQTVSMIPDVVVPGMAGFTARVLTAIVTAPIEMIRTNQQANPRSLKTQKGLLKIMKNTVSSGGFLSLYSGLFPTLLRDAPFSVIYWTFYERIRQGLQNIHFFQGQDFSIDFISGASAGMIGGFTTNPFDVVKTRMQMTLPSDQKNKPQGSLEVAKSIWKYEGIRGFYQGLVPRLVRVAPACAIMISSYNLTKKFVFFQNERR